MSEFYGYIPMQVQNPFFTLPGEVKKLPHGNGACGGMAWSKKHKSVVFCDTRDMEQDEHPDITKCKI